MTVRKLRLNRRMLGLLRRGPYLSGPVVHLGAYTRATTCPHRHCSATTDIEADIPAMAYQTISKNAKFSYIEAGAMRLGITLV